MPNKIWVFYDKEDIWVMRHHVNAIYVLGQKQHIAYGDFYIPVAFSKTGAPYPHSEAIRLVYPENKLLEALFGD